jgi:GH25 family lysozyme M1 (1,4-beta-N-acetylmuramidase)
LRIPTTRTADFLDISGWQWPIDAVKMSEKVGTVWVRSSIRTRAQDAYWWPLQEELREAGIQVNTYAVWDSRYSGQGHWANLVQELSRCPAGDRHHFEIAIDVEDDVRRTRPQLEQLRVFFEASSNWNGRPTWMYTSYGLWNDWANHGPVNWAYEFPLWAVDYRKSSIARGYPQIPTDWYDYCAWQYSGNGNMMGQYYGTKNKVSIDLNHWREEDGNPQTISE